MSLDALRDVMTRSHTAGAARLVLLVIAYHANPKTGDSYCSRRLLAQEANVSTATVHAALGELLAKGEIEILMCGTGRKSTTYRLTASDSAIEPLADGVAAQSATRSGSPDGPVVAQSAGPSIGGTEEQGKVEPRASTAPPDGGASRSNGQVPPDAAAAIAALKASSRRVPTVPVSRPAGPDAPPVSAAAATAQQAAPKAARPTRRSTRGGRKGRRGREPPATCTRSRTTSRSPPWPTTSGADRTVLDELEV